MRRPSLPRDRRDWRRIAWAVRHVLRRPPWATLAVLVAVLSLTTFVAADRTVFVRTVVVGGNLSLAGRIAALATLFPDPAADGIARTGLLVGTAALVGTNVSLLGYQFRHNRARIDSGAGGVLGVVFATLGAGCASCGLAVVASALSLSGVATGLAALPFDGVEFLVVALVVTVLSLHWTAAGIESGSVEGCPVDR